MAGKDNGRTRLSLRISEKLADYLDKIVEVGIHGATPSEVVRKFVENEVERMVRERIIQLPERSKSMA